MALLLTESDVRSLLTMQIALEAVEAAFRRLADGQALMHSRQRLHLQGKSYLHYMAAGDASGGYMGMKIYTSSREGLRFLVPLFHADSGDLLALIEADYLGQMRTGAASGLATKLLSRADARSVGIIGTGLQARTQLEAVVAVRKIEQALAYGRGAQRRTEFAKEMTAKLGIRVEASETPEEVVRAADILITATTASQPIVKGEWLKPGAHINAIGANFPQKREMDISAVSRADIIYVDSREQARLEAGDLIHGFEGNSVRWDSVKELAELVRGREQGRTSREQITLFKSSGIAIEDVVTGERVYELALAHGIGTKIKIWEMAKEAKRTRS
ncbi:MAG TPA: ornithine cyclodeaminase family protein [Candidatus Acidoferrales bacterium]|nr:ornithine cyclodeaminase family protein [Candidatus Acidoferrales bacterium]